MCDYFSCDSQEHCCAVYRIVMSVKYGDFFQSLASNWLLMEENLAAAPLKFVEIHHGL